MWDSEGPAISLTLFRDVVKSFGLLYPFVESQISCVLLSSGRINTQFSYMFAVCSLSFILLWDTQTRKFLLAVLLLKLTDPLQAEDFGCPVKDWRLVNEPCWSVGSAPVAAFHSAQMLQKHGRLQGGDINSSLLCCKLICN